MDESEGKDAAEQAMKEGYAFLPSGAHEQALASFTRAEDLFGEAGDRRRQARASTNKALVLVQLQRFDEAIAGFKEALEHFEEEDEFIRVAEQCGNVGSVHRDMGQPDEALENYEEALTIYRELGLRERAADQCTNIAYVRFHEKKNMRRLSGVTARRSPSTPRPAVKRSAASRPKTSPGWKPPSRAGGMKGLDLAEAYYGSVGLAMIRERFRAFEDRLAVGLAGPGSECFGFDDEVSRTMTGARPSACGSPRMITVSSATVCRTPTWSFRRSSRASARERRVPARVARGRVPHRRLLQALHRLDRPRGRSRNGCGYRTRTGPSAPTAGFFSDPWASSPAGGWPCSPITRRISG